VTLPDLNLLLYAVNADSPRHAPARQWLSDALNGRETVAFAWVVLLGFVRLATSARVFPAPLSADQALELVDGWLGRPCATVVHPTDRHARVLRDLLIPLGAAGNLTTDAHLAALAIEHGAELHSTDPDFGRFPGLRWRDPIGDAGRPAPP